MRIYCVDRRLMITDISFHAKKKQFINIALCLHYVLPPCYFAKPVCLNTKHFFRVNIISCYNSRKHGGKIRSYFTHALH